MGYHIEFLLQMNIDFR